MNTGTLILYSTCLYIELKKTDKLSHDAETVYQYFSIRPHYFDFEYYTEFKTWALINAKSTAIYKLL